MKKDIHPTYGKSTVTCSCGNSFETQATVPTIHVELCSACHPFYTGQQKIVDTAGKVERFKERMQGKRTELISKKEKRAKRNAARADHIRVKE